MITEFSSTVSGRFISFIADVVCRRDLRRFGRLLAGDGRRLALDAGSGDSCLLTDWSIELPNLRLLARQRKR